MKYLKQSQILVSNYPYYKYSLRYALESLQRMGADALEFYACYPHFHMDDVSYWDVRSLRHRLSEYKLSVRCFTPEQCIYPVNIAAADITARKRSIEVFRKSIQYGAELEADCIVVLAGYALLDEEEDHAWRRSVESLKILGEEAESYGISLVLETSPREYTTTHNSRDAVRMIREVGSPAVKGMIDTATLGYSGETMQEAIDGLEGNLYHVHVADGNPTGHLAIGDGNLNLVDMLEKLDDVKYKGALSLEILNDRYIRNPEDAMKISFQKLKEYIE